MASNRSFSLDFSSLLGQVSCVSFVHSASQISSSVICLSCGLSQKGINARLLLKTKKTWSSGLSTKEAHHLAGQKDKDSYQQGKPTRRMKSMDKTKHVVGETIRMSTA